MLENVEGIFQVVIHCSVLLIEILGAGILFVSVIRSFVSFLKGDREAGEHVLDGLATSLSFLLCAEVMHTIAVESWNELLMLGVIMALRGAITLVRHLEKKSKHM